MTVYRTRIEMGNLNGKPFLDLLFLDNPLRYPVKYRRFVVPVVHEPLDSYREDCDLAFFLDFRGAIVPGADNFWDVYECRTKQADLLRDFENAVYERVEDAIACVPQLFEKPMEFVFMSDAGLKSCSGEILDWPIRLKAKKGPQIYKGIGEE